MKWFLNLLPFVSRVSYYKLSIKYQELYSKYVTIKRDFYLQRGEDVWGFKIDLEQKTITLLRDLSQEELYNALMRAFDAIDLLDEDIPVRSLGMFRDLEVINGWRILPKKEK